MKVLSILFVCVFCVHSAYAEGVTLARQGTSYISDMAQPIIECTLKKAGFTYEIKIVPWKRAQVGTEHGAYDGFFVATETEKRNKYATRSAPVLSNDWLFVQLEKAYTPLVNDAFWDQRFTANLGTAKLRWLKQHVDEGKITGGLLAVNTLELAWQHLLNQKADVLLENRINLQKLRTDYPTDQPLKVDIAREVKQGVYFSNAFLSIRPDFLPSFNKALTFCLSRVSD